LCGNRLGFNAIRSTTGGSPFSPQLLDPHPHEHVMLLRPRRTRGVSTDAHMIYLQRGDVRLTLRREDSSYFWEVIGVEPPK
jgi:hypothetical protein